MGCAGSLSFVERYSVSKKTLSYKTKVFIDRFREPAIVITEKQKSIVKRQWRVLSIDKKRTGTAVFMKIFIEYPELKELFPYKDTEKKRLPSDSAFKGHAIKFMHAVGAAVENIDDLENAMSTTLLNLGKHHFGCTGFRPIYFEIFYRAIAKVWKESLGICYTNESEEAWRQVLVFMMEQLKKGYHLASIEQVTLNGQNDNNNSMKYVRCPHKT